MPGPVTEEGAIPAAVVLLLNRLDERFPECVPPRLCGSIMKFAVAFRVCPVLLLCEGEGTPEM